MRSADDVAIRKSGSTSRHHVARAWLVALAVIGLLLAAAILALPLVDPESVRADQAAADRSVSPELHAAEVRIERSGALKGYEPLY